MPPSRAVALGFAPARNCRLALPCPLAGATSEIHATSADAVHAHSGLVVTVTVPVPPLAPTASCEVDSVTAHLAAAGPVTDSDDVEPQAATRRVQTRAPTMKQNSRRIDWRRDDIGARQRSKLQATNSRQKSWRK